MKFVNAWTSTVVVLGIYAALFVLLEVLAFWHSKWANFGLALLMIFGPIIVLHVREKVHRLSGDDGGSRLFMSVVGFGFLAACLWFGCGAFWAHDPQEQVLMAVLPFAVGLVIWTSYKVDKTKKAELQMERERITK